MNTSFFLTAILAVSLALPSSAQTAIEAPNGWKTQTRANGATTFTPPDLRNGEIFSITTYNSAPLNGQTLEEFLRKFAGPVGKKPGQLGAPLKIQVKDGEIAFGGGAYVGLGGKALGVMFVGMSLDANNISVSRALYSDATVQDRYQDSYLALVKSLSARATTEAGSNNTRVPAKVTGIKRGGNLVPGVYAGNQYADGKLRYRLRVYVYPSGEYRITDHLDQDFKSRSTVNGVGEYSYNRNNGQLNLDSGFDLTNSNSFDRFCYFGRDSAGKPIIYAEMGALDRVRTLRYVGLPTKRLSPKTEAAREAAIEAEKNRYKWVTAPGRGVPNAKIAAVVHHYDIQLMPGPTGFNSDITNEVYLLLKDGTVHAGLPVAPDQFDVVRSRQKEPAKWGRWRQAAGKTQVSWQGAPFQALRGNKVLPAPAQLRLAGQYRAASSSSNMMGSSLSVWGVTFDKAGRFSKTRSGSSLYGTMGPINGAPTIASGYDDDGSFSSVTGDGFAAASKRKNNPNGDRQGTYGFNSYTLTLRYDNGQIARLPFFFRNSKRTELWFEGDALGLENPQ